MKKRIINFVLGWLLVIGFVFSCAHREPEIQIQYVEKAVPVYCVKEEKLPVPYKQVTDHMKADDNIYTKVKFLVADEQGLSDENESLWEILLACTEKEN